MTEPSYSPFASPEHELAWAAGLFEGEGTFCAVKANRAGGHSYYTRAAIGSTDHDVIVRFHLIIGFGRIYGPYDKNGSAGIRPKPIYFWRATNREEFEQLTEMLWPFLSERRQEQIREVFEKVTSGVHPAMQTAEQ